MHVRTASKSFFGILALALALSSSAACTNDATNANTTTTTTSNVNTTNINTTAATNTNTTTTTGTTIETREPEQYRATMVIRGQTAGNQQAAAEFTIDIARRGADRYYRLNNLPGVGQITYIDRPEKSYVIIPSQRQYYEVTPETTGFKVPRAMTPGMMVEQLQKQQGVTLVGEEQLNGRTVTKYRYAGTAQTGSQAGEVRGETFVYVDKETGLPLRAEGSSQSSGNVQGVSGGNAVMELRDLQTTVDPTLFDVPPGYRQLTREQVQQQMRAVLAVVEALAGGMGGMGGGNTGGNTAPPPTTTTTPATNAAPGTTTNTNRP
ncbi:MAG TPA: hypothetical protein VF666_19190 [Pyrinomonadaceae bacterium]|jgi:hypothetical protein